MSLGPSISNIIHFNSEVQLGQRTALIGMIEKQKGHSFVTGTVGGVCRFSLFTLLTRRNIEKDTIKKVTTVLIKSP